MAEPGVRQLHIGLPGVPDGPDLDLDLEGDKTRPADRQQGSPPKKHRQEGEPGAPGLTMDALRQLLAEQSHSLLQAQQMQMATSFQAFEERQSTRLDHIETKVTSQGSKMDEMESQLKELASRLSQVEARPAVATTTGPDRKTTLVFGGWAEGTRRQILLQQLQQALQGLDLWGSLDSAPFCTGARRSVALCNFRRRAHEGSDEPRGRMMQIVQAINASQVTITGAPKPLWASFSKTPEERGKAAVVSAVRKVLLRLHTPRMSDLDAEYNTGRCWVKDDQLSGLGDPPSEVHHARVVDTRAGKAWIDERTLAKWVETDLSQVQQAVKDAGRKEIEKEDLILLQEVPREKEGWMYQELAGRRVVSHRAERQWRGTGLWYDSGTWCVLRKLFTNRGTWFKLKHLERPVEVWIGTAHFSPGVPVSQYEEEVHNHFTPLPQNAHRVVFQGDVNTPFGWSAPSSGEIAEVAKEGKGSILHKVLTERGLRLLCPSESQLTVPTSRPRQENRDGQCIDVMAVSHLRVKYWHIHVDSYLQIGTDHELCEGCLVLDAKRNHHRHETQPRVWTGQLRQICGMDQGVIESLARTHTKPAPGQGYKDPSEVRKAFRDAKRSGTAAAWKGALKLRKDARKHWEWERLQRASQGDWKELRGLKPCRHAGWDISFAEQQAGDPHEVVHRHLAAVYSGAGVPEEPQAWTGEVRAFSMEELRVGVQHLKRGKAVGADLTSTELIHRIMEVEGGPQHLLEWYNRILATGIIPQRWNEPILILLPKVRAPKAAKELRPIAMGSAVSKLFSRLLLNRALPLISPQSYAQCSGPGRQTSDFLYSIIRLFELTREWGNPLVVFKLDLEKAFDSLDRQVLLEKLEAKIGQGAELHCWKGLLRGTTGILQTPWGSSRVPMGRGIKQGAVESPVIFAYIAELALLDAVSLHGWRNLNPLFPDLSPEEMLYMDDGMLWNGLTSVVQSRAQQLSVEFSKYGLKMNAAKCQLYTTPNVEGEHAIYLNGVRIEAASHLEVMGLSLRVGMSTYELVSPATTRARAKFWELRHIFRAKGNMKQRARVMERIIGGTALWFICSVPPDKATMTALNSAQLQLMVWLLRFAKARDETWEDFRQRAFRGARAALHAAGVERWSTVWLRRWWSYAGAGVVLVRCIDRATSCDSRACLAPAMALHIFMFYLLAGMADAAGDTPNGDLPSMDSPREPLTTEVVMTTDGSVLPRMFGSLSPSPTTPDETMTMSGGMPEFIDPAALTADASRGSSSSMSPPLDLPRDSAEEHPGRREHDPQRHHGYPINRKTQVICDPPAWFTSATARLEQLRRQGEGQEPVWLAVLRRVEHRANPHYLQWCRTFLRPLRAHFRSRLEWQLYTRPLSTAEIQWARDVELATAQDYAASCPSGRGLVMRAIPHLPTDDRILAQVPQPQPTEADPMFGIFQAAWVNTRRGTWGPSGTSDPDAQRQPAEDETVGCEETTEFTSLLTLSRGAPFMSLLQGVLAVDRPWQGNRVPYWFDDMAERVELMLDRGMKMETFMEVFGDRFAMHYDGRFCEEVTTTRDEFERRLRSYRQIEGDPVIERMGRPTEGEIEDMAGWCFQQIRTRWLRECCPEAMANMEHEANLAAHGFVGITVTADRQRREQRERDRLSRSRTPHRRGRETWRMETGNPSDDEAGLFQLPAGGQTRWERLIEQMWQWFEEGRAIGMAICMLRSRAMSRQEAAYLEWVLPPIATLGAGFPNSSGQDESTTPQNFYDWAREIEEHLYGYYQAAMEGQSDEAQGRVNHTSGDDSSMMERDRYRNGRRRIRDSRTPRRNAQTRQGGGTDAGREARLTRIRERTIRRTNVATTTPTAGEASSGSGGRCHEPASGSRDPAPVTLVARPTIAGFPNVTQPMSSDQAVNLWRYYLFDREHFGPRLEGNARVPSSFLPPRMLREISAQHEAMTVQNRLVSTCALVTVLRYLMSELSQTLDVADAIARSRVSDTVEVPVEEEGDDDANLLVQTFLLTDGKDTMESRWRRAITRLHKELLQQPGSIQRLHVRMIQQGIPPLVAGDSCQWVAQLQALLVALEADLVGSPVAGEADAHLDWLMGWVNEIAAFVPGFLSEPTPLQVDSQSTAPGPTVATDADDELLQLLEDEDSERRWQDQRAREEAEERRRLQAHRELCERELAELQAEAEAYRAWENAEVRKATASSRPSPSKRRCVMTLEAASGSEETPTILHTLSVDVPLTGEPLTLTIRARMEPEPENVSTVAVDSAAEGRDGTPPQATAATCSSLPNLFPELAFQDYEQVYARWRRGEITTLAVAQQYGAEVADLVQTQYAVGQAENMSMERGGGLGLPPLEPVDTRELSPVMAPDHPRPQFPFFESMYGQWKSGLRTSENIAAAFGPRWLQLFEMWRREGLQAIEPLLVDVLQPDDMGGGVGDANGQTPGNSGIATVLDPTPCGSGRISYSVVKQVHAQWMKGLLKDETVHEIYGPDWLRLFRRMRDEGVDACKEELSQMVVWDSTEPEPEVPEAEAVQSVEGVATSTPEQEVKSEEVPRATSPAEGKGQ
ncbi:unnamed protein product [Symbiodinium sp. CCMP2592]|nr:unnamed protein product [Symbiodinium sp. CCMP2592]